MRATHPSSRLLLASFAALGMLAAVGCSVTVYSRGVEGSGPHRDLEPGAVLAVLPDEPSEGDVETAAKLETLLVREGYEIGDLEDADFVVLFHYEVDTDVTRRSIEPLSGPAAGIRSAEREGPFDHTVHVRLVEAAPWREDGETRLVWAGAAQVVDAPTESARFLNVALVCAVEDFGEATAETVAERVRIYDRRVRRLE